MNLKMEEDCFDHVNAKERRSTSTKAVCRPGDMPTRAMRDAIFTSVLHVATNTDSKGWAGGDS